MSWRPALTTLVERSVRLSWSTVSVLFRVMLGGVAAVVVAACGIQDASTPVSQPDTQLFGRIAEISDSSSAPGVKEVEIQAGLPEAVETVMRREGRLVPRLESDVKVRVKVTPDTVCVVDLEPADLSAFRIGEEVAVMPAPGSSTMTGTKLLEAEAAAIYDFPSFEVQYMPKALTAMPAIVTSGNDPRKINSSGLEETPIPVQGGRVVYFAAGLLLPVSAGSAAVPRGAIRPGMSDAAGALAPWATGGYRPYRVAFAGSAWGEPQPVELPGLPPGCSARITWVDDAETDCLVEVLQAGKPYELLESRRQSAPAPWGALTRVAEAKGASVGDAQRFGKNGDALVWTVYDAGSSNLWLRMPGKEAEALEPRINTMGPEWAPRVGPNTTLYFCRGERQLLFAGGAVNEVRLPGVQRRPLLEAAPTRDGRYLFCRIPRFTPVEVDWDLAVATKDGTGWGKAVRLDDWRPE
jgi:hypothetical protein